MINNDNNVTKTNLTSGKENNNSNNELDPNLKKAVKGTGIIFIGAVIGTIFGLISTILVARYYSVGQYGLYGLGLFIVGFILGISQIGITQGCPRYISYYRGKNDLERIKGTINSSFLIIIVSSSIFAVSLFLIADYIAVKLFNIPELGFVLRTLAVALPFWALINLIISIFQGFESVKEKVYFSDFAERIFKIPFFVIIIILGLSFDYIIIGYMLSIIIVSITVLLYFFYKLPKSVKIIKGRKSQIKILLAFSWPLVFASLGGFLLTGSDKVMLGILTTEIEIGLYNAATPIARYLTFFLSTTIFIFQPIASRLLAQDRMDELKRNYQILTKWLFTVTFPLLVVLLLFPEMVISLLFGSKYVLASTALQLLTIGYFIHVFMGPNGATITVLGKTRMIMYFTFIGGTINLFLNYYFIPIFGINGAASSTMISFIIINLFYGIYLYKISNIHPFTKNFITPVLLSILFLTIFYLAIRNFQLYFLPIYFKIFFSILIVFLYFVFILLTKSFDKEDLQLLQLVETKTGMRFKRLRKLLRKFI